jgi:hypothetical protein
MVALKTLLFADFFFIYIFIGNQIFTTLFADDQIIIQKSENDQKRCVFHLNIICNTYN